MTNNNYLKNFHKLCAEYDDNFVKGLSSKEIERINSTSALISRELIKGKVLDVGCRDGRITNVLSSKYDVIGLDLGLESLKKVQKNKICASIENLPFPDKTFDLVICTEVLEHLPSTVLRKGIEELKRVTKRFILVSVPFMESLAKGYVLCLDCGKVYHQYGHLRSFNRRKLKGMFHGFNCKYSVLTGDMDAKWVGPLYHVLHSWCHTWAVPDVGLCPFCGFQNPRGAKVNLLRNSLIQRGIWRLEKISPFKQRNTIAILFEIKA